MSRGAFVLAAVAVIAAGAIAYFATQGGGDDTGGDPIAIVVPELSEMARAGEVAFNDNCAACHGENAAGTDRGPPLVHVLYETGHHADGAFLLAVRNGVRAHHWRFGNMPPQRQVTDEEVPLIVQYVRELQRANGIF